MAKIMYVKDKYGHYSVSTPKYTLNDLADDLPDEAEAALRDVPNAEEAHFVVSEHGGWGGIGLLCWVSRGQSGDHYQYDPRTKKWTKTR
jgi:hypothetical protein